MRRDSRLMRGDGPTIFAQVKHGVGVADILELLTAEYTSMQQQHGKPKRQCTEKAPA